MKIRRLFESKVKMKQYFVCCNDNYYTIFILKEKLKYQLKVRKIYYYDEEFEPERGLVDLTDLNRDIAVIPTAYDNSIIYSSDNLEDCKYYIKLKIAAKSYNL